MSQRPWSEYEAIILLEAYIQVLKGEKSRKEAIGEVSETLRQLAVFNGEKIDDIFRNGAGITFQMCSMESAFLGKTLRKPATKLFADVVWMRKRKKEEYAELLKKTRLMVASCKANQLNHNDKNHSNKTSSVSDKSKAGDMSLEEQGAFREVLEKNFQEGLALNAIRLDKFRMICETMFGFSPCEDDERLIEKLKIIGEYVDGRIYPSHNEKQNNLLNDIRYEIRKVLSEGASCVYISAAFQRWRAVLAEQLNVYNEQAFRDLIIAENMPDVLATNTVLKMSRNRVYPENDVIEYMVNKHMPVSYENIQKELWYIPIEVIKRTLSSTPSMASVDVETYLYAPNFPASESELQRLVELMEDKIAEKTYLVSKDISKIINEQFPAIAINTRGYKDWAYRNILKYLFRDYFEFGNSVVSKKGQRLEMWQVYRSFCKSYETLAFDELKAFSNEIGVQIYWDDVMTEMVRVNAQKMVRKDLVQFDVDATDCVLDAICQDDYIPIKQVGMFLHFPQLEYPWNSFLLESYMRVSKRFSLYHVSYSENDVCGVIVRKESDFQDYRQVVVDMLARNTEWSNAEEALALVVKKGYQARRRWTGFDMVVQEALLLREKIQMERN